MSAKTRRPRNDVVDEHLRRYMFGECAGRCTNPDCKVAVSYIEPVTGRARTVGEVAHIFSVQPGGERHRPDFPPAERDAPQNLLVLCPTCHDKVDKPGAERAFPASLLHKWRRDRQLEIDRTAARPLSSFGFNEVQRVIRLLPRMAASDTEPVPPPSVDRKLVANDLSDAVRTEVRQGLARSGAVSEYLQHQAALDPGTTEEIETAMQFLYREHRARLDGDALYYQLLNELTYGLHQPRDRDAAQAVLAWFFHTCDIFERPA